MRRATAMIGVAAFVFWTTTASFAQGKTDFSGTWNRDGAGGDARFGAAFTCGVTCSITQTGNTITLNRTQGEAKVKDTFVVDGKTVNKNQGPARRGGAPMVTESTAKWDGAKVVVTSTRDMQGTAVTSTHTLSIEGGKLTIVSTSTMEGATPQTTTYTKG